MGSTCSRACYAQGCAVSPGIQITIHNYSSMHFETEAISDQQVVGARELTYIVDYNGLGSLGLIKMMFYS